MHEACYSLIFPTWKGNSEDEYKNTKFSGLTPNLVFLKFKLDINYVCDIYFIRR